jgi:hypothetical protein
MSQKILSYDERLKHFSLGLVIVAINNQEKPRPFKFILDTGATTTAINTEITDHFQININTLPTVEVTSIDNIKNYPIVSMDGIIFGESGPEKFFRLDKVIVLYEVSKVKKYKSQMVEKKSYVNLPNIFGLDLLQMIKGKVILDFKDNNFLLEW